jgi:hypothetical protein
MERGWEYEKGGREGMNESEKGERRREDKFKQ